MKDLIPRLFDETEAKRHGIQSGWYGTKQSGTFVTGPSPDLEACMKAMKEAPEPSMRVELVADVAAEAAPPKQAERDISGHVAFNAESRAAYQMGRKVR
jgi:hypothetical protein